MDSDNFVQLLHEEIKAAQGAVKKHIIHFQNEKYYQQCVSQLKRLSPTLTCLSDVKQLKIIHSISCSLRTCKELLKFPTVMLIEEDTQISVHKLSAGSKHTEKVNRVYNGDQLIPWGVNQIKAPQVWDKSLGSRVKVGIIDTGIDYYHPDLRHSISRGVNLINRSLLPIDDNGHGTHIAGTIAAASSRQGILGVAPHALIHAVKAFDFNGSAYVSDIIAGIDWCVQNDINIINMSFGMKAYSSALEHAVKSAYYAGKLIVASSGNEGKKAFIDYPARFPQVMSVGATTKTNKIAQFSNRGKRIDIYAPGEKIYSSWLHGKYNELSGTSMATAHVTGVIALMLAKKPNLQPSQIKQIIKQNALTLNKHRREGWEAGQINARRSINALLK